MEKQVKVVTKSCFSQIRNISRIWQYATGNACWLVTSGLVNIVQGAHNTTARHITRTKKKPLYNTSSCVNSLEYGAVPNTYNCF